ncbi:hypothetical protein SAMN02745216_00948 [Desulfatibacillum alkenivorans DSM 16219]|jgi:hypothetical protein|uniref:Uncharacterized protein n=1 Tax=Desulfatibacillum alkenivorans DSM 16219 TaxID=1121393 RepID=A0A1M6GA53_9BACT|nr:hypothetical protein [Desulfatibacillum alkenivorans]SHJ06801.1 hypothetical protein SAMN02745216_00948 [Desulfatibacillum alkenivorans DSM 16219]
MSNAQENGNGFKFAWIAFLWACGFMAACKIMYNIAWYEFAPGMHKPVTFVAGVLLFAVLALAPAIVYPIGRKRGASGPLLVLVSFLTLLIWDAWEVYRVTEFFTIGESLYYGLNSVFIAAVLAGISEMGAWEAYFRKKEKKEGGPGLMGPVLTALAGLALLYVVMFWNLGQSWFYIYQSGYRALF